MPWRTPLERVAQRSPYGVSYFVWRAITVFSLVVALGALVLAPFLFNKLDEAIETNKQAIASNKAFICAMGSLVTISHGPRRAAIEAPHEVILAEYDFLMRIRTADCPLIESRPETKREITATILLIRHFLQGAVPSGR